MAQSWNPRLEMCNPEKPRVSFAAFKFDFHDERQAVWGKSPNNSRWERNWAHSRAARLPKQTRGHLVHKRLSKHLRPNSMDPSHHLSQDPDLDLTTLSAILQARILQNCLKMVEEKSCKKKYSNTYLSSFAGEPPMVSCRMSQTWINQAALQRSRPYWSTWQRVHGQRVICINHHMFCVVYTTCMWLWKNTCISIYTSSTQTLSHILYMSKFQIKFKETFVRYIYYISRRSAPRYFLVRGLAQVKCLSQGSPLKHDGRRKTTKRKKRAKGFQGFLYGTCGGRNSKGSSPGPPGWKKNQKIK